jgi:hypothetical protein
MAPLTDVEQYGLTEFATERYVLPQLEDIEPDARADDFEQAADRLGRWARIRRLIEDGDDPTDELIPLRDALAEFALSYRDLGVVVHRDLQSADALHAPDKGRERIADINRAVSGVDAVLERIERALVIA